MKNSDLIVMLTHNDRTVENAFEIFDECKTAKAKCWGFKDKTLSLYDMKKLFSYMKELEKTTFLEVVGYTEEEGMDGAKMALECNVDVLMGTAFFDSINDFCLEHNLKYMPFVGKVTGRPSVLEGDIQEILRETDNYIKKGVYGIDLLSYRYTGDVERLNDGIIKNINVPVCIAGSINNYERLDEIKRIKPELFTIGGAFFENKFGGSFKEQIDKVCEYMEK